MVCLVVNAWAWRGIGEGSMVSFDEIEKQCVCGISSSEACESFQIRL